MHWTCFSVKKDRTIATARRTADWRVFPGINVANVKPLCKNVDQSEWWKPTTHEGCRNC